MVRSEPYLPDYPRSLGSARASQVVENYVLVHMPRVAQAKYLWKPKSYNALHLIRPKFYTRTRSFNSNLLR